MGTQLQQVGLIPAKGCCESRTILYFKGIKNERTLDFNNQRHHRSLLDSGTLEGERLGRCPGDDARPCGDGWWAFSPSF